MSVQWQCQFSVSVSSTAVSVLYVVGSIQCQFSSNVGCQFYHNKMNMSIMQSIDQAIIIHMPMIPHIYLSV